jgi:hypothetical protein
MNDDIDLTPEQQPDPEPLPSMENLLRKLEEARSLPPPTPGAAGIAVPVGIPINSSPLSSEIAGSLATKNHVLDPRGKTEVWLSENRPTRFFHKAMSGVQVTIFGGRPAIGFHYLETTIWETVVLAFTDPNFDPLETLPLALGITSGDLHVLHYGELTRHLPEDHYKRFPAFSPTATVDLEKENKELADDNKSLGKQVNDYAKGSGEMSTLLARAELKKSQSISENKVMEGKVRFWRWVSVVLFFLLVLAVFLLARTMIPKNQAAESARLGMWHTAAHAYLANGAIGPLGTLAARSL